MVLYLMRQPRFITVLLLVAISFGNGEEAEGGREKGDMYIRSGKIFYYMI